MTGAVPADWARSPLATAIVEGLEPSPRWMRDALCLYGDPDTWFPEKGDTPEPAKRICRRCPSRFPCLEYGLNERYGVWGGLSYTERRQLVWTRRAS